MYASKRWYLRFRFFKIPRIFLTILFLLTSCSSPARLLLGPYHHAYISTETRSDSGSLLTTLQSDDEVIPVKLHMADGAMILCNDGFTVAGDTLYGSGLKYDLTRSQPVSVAKVALSSIVNVQYYEQDAQDLQITAVALSTVLIGCGIIWAIMYGTLSGLK